MANDFYNLIRGLLRVFASPLSFGTKTRVAWTFFRLRLKNRIFQWTGRAPCEENVLGRRFRFFNYSTFVYLFEEIFIDQSYNFKASRPNPVIIDAGANVGLSVLFLKLLYPAARIIAFEPDPATFNVLKLNVETNRLQGVELRNKALLDRDGEVEFHTDSAKPGSPAMTTVAGRPGLKVPATFAVPCVTLSSQLGGDIDFMKMDIEGAEAACLSEAAKTGRLQLVDQMIIECHHNMGMDGALRGVLNTLENNGYSYQVNATSKTPYSKHQPQDVHVYAYRS